MKIFSSLNPNGIHPETPPMVAVGFMINLNTAGMKGAVRQMGNTKKILLAWTNFTLNGGILRFVHCQRIMEEWGHEMEFCSLENNLETPIPALEHRILDWETAQQMDWDAVMVPGAGLSNSQMKLLAKLQRPSFGIRVQHILNDPSRKAAFLKVNHHLRPHLLIANNSHWSSFSNFEATNFTVIPGAIDQRLHQPGPKRTWPLENDIIHVGGYGRKHPDSLVEAIFLLGQRFHLHLYGVDHCPHPLAACLKTEGRLSCHGVLFDNELAGFYDHLDLMVVTEEKAGWCNSAAQAMAHGLPVITTPFGTIDFAIHHKNAIISDTRHPRNIMKAIEQLIHDKKMAIRIGQEAARTMRRYSWENYSAELLEAIQPLMKRPS